MIRPAFVGGQEQIGLGPLFDLPGQRRGSGETARHRRAALFLKIAGDLFEGILSAGGGEDGDGLRFRRTARQTQQKAEKDKGAFHLA